MWHEPLKNLVITADDLGFSPAVNHAILHGAKRGTITSASLMVSMPFAEEAAAIVGEQCPALGLGLHFSLTAGKSVAPPESVPLLTDSQGKFRYGFAGLYRLLKSKAGHEALSQIRREFSAQTALMASLQKKHALCIDHLDSHQHIHVFPGLFELLWEEARKRQIVLRIPHEHFGTIGRWARRFPTWFPAGICKREILKRFLFCRMRHFKTPHTAARYFGILESGKIGEHALLGILEAVKNDTSGAELFEVNVHPSSLEMQKGMPEILDGFIGPADRKFHQSPWRQKESNALTDTRVHDQLKKSGINLSGFSSKK